MPDLDQIFNEARLNADRVELQKKLLGHIVQDEEPILDALPAKQPKAAPPTSGGEGVVELSASKPSQVSPQDVGFVQPENMRSNAEIDAKLAQDAKAKKPVPGFHEPGLVVGEAVGVAGSGAMTTLEDPRNAWIGLGPIGMAKLAKGGGGLIRDRFQVEGLVERALNPSPLAERMTNAINARTAVLTDEEANKQAAALVKSGAVSLETVTNYAPGLAHQSLPHALAAADVLTKEAGHFTDTARLALETEDPLLIDQALTQLDRIIDPLAGNEGAITPIGQILRRVSSPEIKGIQLVAERTSKLTEGMPPLEQLRTIMADASTDPAKQGKALSQSYKQLASHAKELVATGDEAGATLFLNDVKAAIEEEAQLGLFPTDKEVKTAQKVIKNVTAQHIVEANQGAARAAEEQFRLTPTGPTPYKPVQQTFLTKPIKAGDQVTDDQVREFNARLAQRQAEHEQSSLTHPTAGKPPQQQALFPKPIKAGQQLTDDQLREYNRQVAEAAKEKFNLTPPPGGAKSAAGKQEDFVAQEEKNKLATIKEHQAQDLRVSEGTSVFSPKREQFKLTPPPGGARPRPMKQQDLLALIAKEPEPEQLALEMAAAVQHPELSKQYLSMIRKAQDAITFGKTEDVGKALQKLQQSLIPPATQATAQPSRMVKTEKDALRAFFQSIHGKPLSDKEILQAMTMDPGLQPEALVKIVNNLKNPTWRDAGQFFVINNMLTPASDFVNFVASASMIPMHLGARAIGERTGQVAQLLGGKPGVVSGETDAMMHGIFSTFGDSLRLAARVAKTNIPEVGKASLREHALGMNPLSANAMFGYSPTARKLAGIADAANYDSASYPLLSRAGSVSAAINFLGVAFGLPGRFMLTGDQWVQATWMQAEIHALVYRKTVEQAQREGLTGADAWKSYRKFWDQTTAAIPSEIRAAGENAGLEVSLNQNPGIIGQRIMGLRESVNDVTMGIGGTLAAPFYNTLANGAKATVDFSPLAPLSQGASALGRTFGGKTLHSVSQHIRDDMFGADPVKRDLAVGKWALGTTMMTGYVFAALNGRLRGRGPDNKELQAVGYEAYGSPDSVIYNTDTGEGIQVSRLGVHGNLMGMAADLAEVWLQLDDEKKVEGLQLLTTAYVGNLSSDFLQGSLGIAQAVMNGVKRKEDFDILAKTTTALIPGGGMIRSLEKQLQPEDDMLMKDARTSLDKFLARVPGYDTLARKYGWEPVPVARSAMFGQAVLQPRSAWGTQAWNPMFLSAPNTNPVIRDTNAIAFRLGMAIQRPAKDVGHDNMPMTNKEYDRYEILAGEFFEQRAIGILPTLKDPTVPDQLKRDLITLHLKDARSAALGVLKGESNDLVEALTATKRDKATNLHAPRKTTRQAISIGQE